ncbi:hypothetical protein Tco_0494960 [Tanacetum coccineum]
MGVLHYALTMNARSTPQNHSGEHGGADGGYHGGDYWRRWWISRWRLLEKTVEKRFTSEEQYGGVCVSCEEI